MNVQELLRKHNIKFNDTAPGRYYRTCPQSSKDCRRQGHKNSKCLGVTIEADGHDHLVDLKLADVGAPEGRSHGISLTISVAFLATGPPNGELAPCKHGPFKASKWTTLE
jgi:hypothetical protein